MTDSADGMRKTGASSPSVLARQAIRFTINVLAVQASAFLKTFVLLGGGGVFAVHTAAYLLKNANPRKVICVGRNIVRSSAYSLDVGKSDDRYRYEQIHIVFEQDRLFELLDREKPDVIINFAALAHSTSW